MRYIFIPCNVYYWIFVVDCGEDEEGVEPWIIIVAILSGLILLAILILIIIRVIIELRVSTFYDYQYMYIIHCLLSIAWNLANGKGN